MLPNLTSKVIPLFRSACNCRYAGIHITWSCWFVFIIWLNIQAFQDIKKANYSNEETFGLLYEFYTTNADSRGIWFGVSFIIGRYIYMIYETTATNIIYDATTQMISITQANFCCGCCTSPTVIWECSIADIIFTGYNTETACFCGSLYAVLLLKIRKNPDVVTAENPDGLEPFVFYQDCDSSCYNEFITLLNSLSLQQSSGLEIINLDDVTPEQLESRIALATAQFLGKTAEEKKNADLYTNLNFNFNPKRERHYL